MSLSLPREIILAKNNLNDPNPWLYLLEFTIWNEARTTSTVFRLVNNTEDIVHGGFTWTAFPFVVGSMQRHGTGQLPEMSVEICNVDMVVHSVLEEYDGGYDMTAKITIVHSDNLTLDYSALERTYEVGEIVCDEEWASLAIGSPSILDMKFPRFMYSGTHCRHGFTSAECKYAGSDTYCSHTYSDCWSKGNIANYGAEIGLQGEVLRVV